MVSSGISDGRECGLPLVVLPPEFPGCVRGCTVAGCSGMSPGVAETVWTPEGTGVSLVSIDA